MKGHAASAVQQQLWRTNSTSCCAAPQFDDLRKTPCHLVQQHDRPLLQTRSCLNLAC